MKHITIRNRLRLLGAIAMLIMLLVGVAGVVSSQLLGEAIVRSDRMVSLLRNQTEADMMHDAIRSDVLNMYRLMSYPSPAPEEIKAVWADMADHLATFRTLVDENDKMALPADERAALNALKPEVASYASQAETALRKFSERAADADQAFKAFSASFEMLEGGMEKFSTLIEASAKRNNQEQGAMMAQVNRISIGAMLVGAVLLFVASWWIAATITSPLLQIRDFLAGIGGNLTRRLPDLGASEIGATAVSINRLLDEQAHTIELIQRAVGSVEQVSGELKTRAGDTREQVEQASERAARVAAAAEQLQAAVQGLGSSIQRTAERASQAEATAQDARRSMAHSQSVSCQLTASSAQSSAIIGQLGEAAGRISSVATVIKEIADQTNLLALNAAIEAARAGESGRGFAVVADEVRKLAERTGSSTTDIAGMTAEIEQATRSAAVAMQAVSDGVSQGVADLAGAMQGQDAIVRDTGEMNGLAREMAELTRSEAQTVEQAAEGMAEIGERIGQAAQAMRAIDAGAEQLLQVVSELRLHVAHFQVDAGGRSRV